MASIDTEHGYVTRVAELRARVTALLSGEQMLMQRLAGGAFLIRVAGAIIAYGSQILIARWMGSYEFGIYAYAWTWVIMLGQASDLGLAQSAQRFIPEYLERKALPLLRGYISGGRWFAVAANALIGGVCAALVYALSPWLDHYIVIPLYLACITLPAYALGNMQDGIARTYDWFNIAFGPTFLLRQVLITGLIAAIYLAGVPVDAVSAIVVSAIAIWGTALGQLVFFNRRLNTELPPGPREYALKTWLATSLPILMSEGFYLLLAYIDILVLQQFRPPNEVAIYYAAVKTLALVSFIYWAIASTAGHRFTEFHVSGNRTRLTALLAQTIRWTFWPSVVATALLLAVGREILDLFGQGFAEGYHLLVILAVGLLARAAVGPIERLLNMLGQQRLCALVYAGAFITNLVLCLILIPRFGMAGAAASTATALIAESALLFWVTRTRLGLHGFIFGQPKAH